MMTLINMLRIWVEVRRDQFLVVKPKIACSTCSSTMALATRWAAMGNCLSFCLFITSDHPEEEFVELLEEVLARAKTHGVVLSPQEEFHLSLSQTVVLRHHWIQPFMQSLKKGLLNCRRFAPRLFFQQNQAVDFFFLDLFPSSSLKKYPIHHIFSVFFTLSTKGEKPSRCTKKHNT